MLNEITCYYNSSIGTIKFICNEDSLEEMQFSDETGINPEKY